MIAAITYADPNSIRAGMAETPGASDIAPIQQRSLKREPGIERRGGDAIDRMPEDLQPAIGGLRPSADQADGGTDRCIPYSVIDDLELADWSGRPRWKASAARFLSTCRRS